MGIKVKGRKSSEFIKNKTYGPYLKSFSDVYVNLQG